MTSDQVRIALDSNILIYAEGAERHPDDQRKIGVARRLLDRIPRRNRVVPVQALGELFNVLTRRIGRSADTSRASFEDWRASSICQPTTAELMAVAVDLARRHRFAIWDAVIVAAAAEAKCDYLLSEDMQHGFVWRGVEIVNPFGSDLPVSLQWLFVE